MINMLFDRVVSSVPSADFMTGKLQHLVQLNQFLLTRILQQEDTLIFPSLESYVKRAIVLSARAPLHECDRMPSIHST
jgi:hypothetical protein